MTKLVSVQIMKKQVGGMIGTKDLSEWEEKFVQSILDSGHDFLSDKQYDKMKSIWEKHFAG